jgi:hypothetical protein
VQPRGSRGCKPLQKLFAQLLLLLLLLAPRRCWGAALLPVTPTFESLE